MTEIIVYSVFFFLCLIGSFFATVWQTAYPATPVWRWDNANKNHKGVIYKANLILLKHYDTAIGTGLIINKVCTVMCTTITAILVKLIFNDWWLSISSALLILVMITFCEYMPKILGRKYSVFWIKYTGIIYFCFYVVFYPITYFYSFVFFAKSRKITATEEELESLLTILNKERVIGKSEQNLVINALNFDDINSHKAITSNYLEIDYYWPIAKVIQTIVDNKTKDHYYIVFKKGKLYGIISAKSFLENKTGKRWHQYIKNIKKFKSTVKLNVLFNWVRAKNIQAVAIVKKSKLIGIVTYHSLIERLFFNHTTDK